MQFLHTIVIYSKYVCISEYLWEQNVACLIISITSMQSKSFFVVTNNWYFVPSHGGNLGGIYAKISFIICPVCELYFAAMTNKDEIGKNVLWIVLSQYATSVELLQGFAWTVDV